MAIKTLDVEATNKAREAASAQGKSAANIKMIKIYSGESGSTPSATPDTGSIENQVYSAKTKADALTSEVSALRSPAQGDANSIINGTQDKDIATKTEDVPVRGDEKTKSSSVSDLMAEINEAIKANVQVEKPINYNREKTYKKLLNQYNITDLEESAADLDQQAEDLKSEYETAKADIEEGVTTVDSVMKGKIGNAYNDYLEKLDKITSAKSKINSELTTKYNVINNLMTLKSQDYETAKTDYEDAYTQQIQFYNMINSAANKEQTEEQQAADNARANANIVYNSISNGTTDPSQWTDSQKTLISGLETKAGLPSGFYSTLAVKASVTKSSILSTSTRQDSSGDKYADIITQGEDGAINVQHVYLGAERLPQGSEKDSGLTDEDKTIANIQGYADDLIEMMSNKNINWETAWSRMQTRYPNLSTNAIDQLLGLENRNKYDK